MTYAVAHQGADGALHLDPAGSLDEAVARAESLRNDEGATDVRVFKEVKIAVKAYYKVEVVEEDAGVAAATASAPTPAAAVEASAPPPGAMPLGPPISTSSDAGIGATG